MSKAKTLLEQLGVPSFKYITLAQYQTLSVKDSNALYFIKGTSLVYKGSSPYGSSIKRVLALPAVADAIPELHYFVVSGNEAGIYVLNATKDAFINITVTKKYVDEKVAEFINDVEYDSSNSTLKFKKPNGEDVDINLPKDNFLSAANFNAENNVLTLELVDGSKVDVPLAELLNVYTGDKTASASVNVSDEGLITANVLISEDADNGLEERANGLFVKATPIVTDLDENSTDEEAVSAKLVFDMVNEMSWSEVV